MEPYSVLGLVTDEAVNPVVLLAPDRPADGSQVLVPVWVGAQDAALISIALTGARAARPLTHDLLENAVAALGGTIVRAELLAGEGDLLDAALVVVAEPHPIRLDCRPADAIALALRCAIPVHVPLAVIDGWGVVEEPQGVAIPVEVEVARFRRLLADAEPEDLTG